MTQQPAKTERFPSKPLNRVVASCPPSGIRRFFDIAQQMEGVIALGVGEPDFVTPECVREAGIRSLQQGITGYTSNSGLPQLREAICRDLKTRLNLDYHADSECLITVGVSEGLDLALRVLLNPGDEVIVPVPCYVAYLPGIEFAGGKAVPVAADAEDGFRIHADRIEAAVTPRTKAIMIASPANPTGAAQSREDVQALVDIAVRHDLFLISDEIYEQLLYSGTHTSPAALPGGRERTVVLNGFSKSYAMTGWRVGYCCGPEEIVTLMTRVHQYTMLCAPTMAQYAALEALNSAGEEVEAMRADYKHRRDLFVAGLNRLNLRCVLPGGAFYAFPSIHVSGLSSEEFVERLLMEEKVAVVPGTAFGPGGEGYIRCSYATALPRLEEALARMERFLDRLQNSGSHAA